ncbi:MAG: 5'-methylthioadenosine/adenosylhomocysteine nucleosidase [Variovorax sp.]|nr:MAG: 5'-methylthioadenosine/adenosylhomocysteine nucleosidase [Variovorax sp.]
MTSFDKKAPQSPLTAILSALAEEQQGLIELLEQPRKTVHAGRDFWQGTLHGQPVVLALSRIGKVAAATTATALIERFQVSRILFTGVAGGLGDGVEVGDIVVAKDFLQHDMDASPLFPRYEMPLYGRTRFHADAALTALVQAAATATLEHSWPEDGRLAFAGAKVHHGLMASGDQFISGTRESDELRQSLSAAGHHVLAVEMEGAAVAQVCHDYAIPFAAVRTISDRADDNAHTDFPAFVRDIASQYARVIVEKFLGKL